MRALLQGPEAGAGQAGAGIQGLAPHVTQSQAISLNLLHDTLAGVLRANTCSSKACGYIQLNTNAQDASLPLRFMLCAVAHQEVEALPALRLCALYIYCSTNGYITIILKVGAGAQHAMHMPCRIGTQRDR
jgi:hypothetical protein